MVGETISHQIIFFQELDPTWEGRLVELGIMAILDLEIGCYIFFEGGLFLEIVTTSEYVVD